MGKRQHQGDKMYLTTTEWSKLYGGYKKESHSGARAAFRRLPLTHCALSLIPFNHPYVDPQGNVYDLEAILPFVRKFKINPVTGKPLSDKDLTRVTFHSSTSDTAGTTAVSIAANDGLSSNYHCPVLYKPFTNNSHVVAIKTTGNVFSYEAIEQLNIKAGNWKELLTDEPFTRADIITLQDPQNLDKFNISSFHHVKNGIKIVDEDSKNDGGSKRLKNISKDTQDILSDFHKSYKSDAERYATPEATKADKFNAAHYSTNAVAAGFTSTAENVATENEAAVLSDNTVRYARIKKKGYVSVQTTAGPINLELYANTVPKTCENFIKLCSDKYYDNTIFHRSIRHFMIQGGDPTGTGKGGQSCWGGSFKDEIRQQFSHKGRGVLSMANSGPDTNKSQFFITYRSCQHLDGKHTIFGRVVGGMDTLKEMEAVETDNKDRPIEPITLLSTNVFVNPFQEVDEQLAKERLEEAAAKAQEDSELRGGLAPKKMKTDLKPKQHRSGVGKFLDIKKSSLSKSEEEKAKSIAPMKKKVTSAYKFKDFSAF